MTLKELRSSKSLTQKAAAALCEIPLRTYVRYENKPGAECSLKYQYLIQKINQYGFVDENHGVLNRDDIVRSCNLVFQNYPVEYCYLFGSYAKGIATETSDVDLLLRTDTTGIKFYGLVERLRETLKKNVDVLEVRQLTNNPELINEILRDGVKIYG